MSDCIRQLAAILEDIAAVLVALIIPGILGVAAGIEVGQALSQAYDASANNKVLNLLANDFNLQPWIANTGPIIFEASHPTTRQFVLFYDTSPRFDDLQHDRAVHSKPISRNIGFG